MARPKTKLREGSTTCFQYATLTFPPEQKEIGISADAAQARSHLALVKVAQAFFNRHAKTIEQIKKQLVLTNGSTADDLVNISALFALLFIVSLCPRAEHDGFASPFDHGLTQKSTGTPPPMDPAASTAFLSHGSDTKIALHRGYVWKEIPGRSERRQ